jgi:hypothetical protein
MRGHRFGDLFQALRFLGFKGQGAIFGGLGFGAMIFEF